LAGGARPRRFQRELPHCESEQSGRRLSLPAAFDDALDALRWVRANAAAFGVDPTRISSMGISAGGTVAAHLGTIPGAVASVVDIAGRMDFTTPAVGVDPRPHFLPQGNYWEASPLAHVGPASAPFLLFHGTEDRQVEIDHSRKMAAALAKAGVVQKLVTGKTDHPGVLDWVMKVGADEIRRFILQGPLGSRGR
jgi:acetyl esterase/lipase